MLKETSLHIMAMVEIEVYIRCSQFKHERIQVMKRNKGIPPTILKITALTITILMRWLKNRWSKDVTIISMFYRMTRSPTIYPILGNNGLKDLCCQSSWLRSV